MPDIKMFNQRVIVPSAILFLLGSSITGATRNIYSSTGYYAYGSSYAYASCPFFGSYVDAYLYSQDNKFKATGRAGYKSTSSFASLSVYFDAVTCDDTTVTFIEGHTYSDTFFGDKVVFELDTSKLTSASLSDVQVPIFSYSCEYQCIEVCYAELFDYGTCPEDELPYFDCYTTTCEDSQQYLGIADVDIIWTGVNPKTPPVQSKDTYVFRTKDYAYKSSSKGASRDATVSFTATWDGGDVLKNSGLAQGYGSIGSSSSMTIDRYRN